MIDALPPVPPPNPAPRHPPRQAGDDRFARLLEDQAPRTPPFPHGTGEDPVVAAEPLPTSVEPGQLPVEGGPAVVDPHAVPASVVQSASQGAGTIDVVERPWQLQGGWGLSYRDVLAASNVADAAGVAPAAATSPAGIEAAVAVSRDGSFGDVARYWRFAPVAEATALVARGTRAGAAEQGGESTVPARFAALLTWPERMLRWQRDGNGETTAWVRDYTLDAAGARRLVDALRCEAAQDDRPLHRIMLNGHAVWRASVAS